MAIIEEPFIPGIYAADINDLQIRTKRETTAPSVGAFKKDEMFPVFEVFPEEAGILWSRTSSNVNGQPSRFVGLRVNNHIKAHLVKAFVDASSDPNAELVAAIKDATYSISSLVQAVMALVNKK